MSYPVYGRYQVAEPHNYEAALLWWKRKQPQQQIKAVSHRPPIGVLDQSDLLKQGIRCSQIVKGATDVDALGNCTANGFTAHFSTLVDVPIFLHATGVSTLDDTVGLEKFAIRFYAGETHLTGQPNQEWPPVDCGSSGPYIFQYAEDQKYVASEIVVNDAVGIASALQTGSLLVGQPFFNAWEQPNNAGFIDYLGLEAAIQSGLAGGHETCWHTIEPAFKDGGELDPEHTVITARNSWGSSWGDHGDYRFRLSTFLPLLHYIDVRQFSVK